MPTPDERKETANDHAKAATTFALTACAQGTSRDDVAKAVVNARDEAKKAREAANALPAGAKRDSAQEIADKADNVVRTAENCAKTKGVPVPRATATQQVAISQTASTGMPTAKRAKGGKNNAKNAKGRKKKAAKMPGAADAAPDRSSDASDSTTGPQ
jgi:hypothetical protein